MQRSHQIGLRVCLASVGAFLAASLLIAAPHAASAGEGRARGPQASGQQATHDAQDGDRQGPSSRVADTPAAERSKGAAAGEAAPAVADDQTRSGSTQPPASRSETASAATTASREPGATSEAVLDTTPADPSVGASPRSIEDLPQAIITATEPVPLGDVNAAGSIDPALRPTLRVVAASQPDPVPTSSPGGLQLDPLVLVSLGLLLLARALRRQPHPDDRTYSL